MASGTEWCGVLNVFDEEELIPFGLEGPQEWGLRMSGRRACPRLGFAQGEGWESEARSGPWKRMETLYL